MKLLLFFCLIVTQCGYSLCPETEQNPIFPIPAKKVSKGNRDFAFDLYNSLYINDLNWAVSPFSLSSCMGMVAIGAEGETLDQLQEVMHFPKGLMLDFGFRWIDEQLRCSADPVQLSPANALWTQKGMPISPAYLTKVMHYWDGIKEADFRNDWEGSRLLINAYVEEKTAGKIVNFLPSGILDNQTRLVAVNTLYLSAPWKKAFPASNTREGIFYGQEHETTISYMCKNDHLPIGHFDHFSMVEIPFTPSTSTESELSLYIVLPDTPDFELDRKLFRKATKSLEEHYVQLHMPKFQFETKLLLKPTLMRLGLTLPFLAEGGFPDWTGEGKMVLTEVIQSVTVDFNEKGATCTAATGAIMGLTSFLGAEDPIDFTVDRPFIFLIVDKHTRSILFMGKVGQP